MSGLPSLGSFVGFMMLGWFSRCRSQGVWDGGFLDASQLFRWGFVMFSGASSDSMPLACYLVFGFSAISCSLGVDLLCPRKVISWCPKNASPQKKTQRWGQPESPDFRNKKLHKGSKASKMPCPKSFKGLLYYI